MTQEDDASAMHRTSTPEEKESFLPEHRPTSNGQSKACEAGFAAPEHVVACTSSDLMLDVGKAPEEDEAVERVQWSHKIEYLLSMTGYCVGLGNVWRFPYICIRNGGGAFLIPFFICLFCCGLPVYFLEIAMGQFVSKSCYHAWSISPLFRGTGLSMIMMQAISSWYYPPILAWILLYLINSFKSPLPWTRCDQSWNTKGCVVPGAKAKDVNATLEPLVVSSQVGDDSNSSLFSSGFNVTTTAAATMGNLSAPAENITEHTAAYEYWTYNILQLSDGLDNMGGLIWENTLAQFVMSVIVALCIWKGVKSVGKVVFVTATLPYILITVLLIKGLTLEGASEGILFYVKPDFSKLLQVTTWIEAGMQVFYSLGPAWGNLVSMASYNKFKNNCMKDAIRLSILCEGTSIFVGFATFSFLGHMAYTLDIPVANFSTSGAGLVFVVYPEAISYLPIPQLWGVLFFLMLLTVGVDTQFVCVESFMTFVQDLAPRFMKKWHTLAKFSILTLLFLTGIIFCCRGGMYFFQLVDWYAPAFTLMFIAIMECIVVGWVYGADRFSRNIALMIGRRPYVMFEYLWKYITTLLLIVACLFTLIFYKAPVYEGYTYPDWGVGIGWIIAMSSFVPIPIFAFITVYLSPGLTIWERIKHASQATDEFMPADPFYREEFLKEKKLHNDTSSDIEMSSDPHKV